MTDPDDSPPPPPEDADRLGVLTNAIAYALYAPPGADRFDLMAGELATAKIAAERAISHLNAWDAGLGREPIPADVRAAAAFLGMGQEQRISISVADDEICVYLDDDLYLSTPFDAPDGYEADRVHVGKVGENDLREVTAWLLRQASIDLALEPGEITDLADAISDAMAVLHGWARTAADIGLQAVLGSAVAS